MKIPSVHPHSLISDAGPHPHATCFVDCATAHGLRAAFGLSRLPAYASLRRGLAEVRLGKRTEANEGGRGG